MEATGGIVWGGSANLKYDTRDMTKLNIFNLKQSFLLTHNTIYGFAPEPTLIKSFDDISSSFPNGWAVPWRLNVPSNQNPQVVECGDYTEVVPIDVVHWELYGAKEGRSGLEIWENCLTLFMRHI